jgi:predicted CoA-binding protein
MSTKDLMREKVIAVVGVSRDERKYGFKVFKDLIQKGMRVYGVNPNIESLLGRKIYSRISEIPERVDIVVTVVPPEVTEKIVDECAQLGIREIWMQPGSESEKAIEKATSLGIRVVHSACIMSDTSR